jgi:quercetin dioxygenase-like cupin family protein
MRYVKYIAPLLMLFCSNFATAQDSVKVSPSVNTVLVENAHVRVVKSSFKPGMKEGTHSHPAGWYIVTHGGDLKVTAANGKISHWLAKDGEQSWMDAEAAHTAENVGKSDFEYILVEVKSAQASKK